MKKLLNFGVSDPLTLGMTHPIADRLERLGRARPTSWTSRCLALSAMSAIALGTAPIGIAAADKSVEVKNNHSLQIKFIPDREGIYMEELQRRLDAVRAGTHDQTYVTDWKGDGMGALLENHIFVSVEGEGDEVKIATTDAQGKPVKRTPTPEVIASIETALMKCVDRTSVSKLPLTYTTNLSAVPEYTLSGPHTVTCMPGTHEERMALSVEEKLEGLRQSTGLDESRRRAMMRGTMAGGLRKTFEAKYENPTREQQHENCLYSLGILDVEYPFLGQEPSTPETIKATCDKSYGPELQ